MLSGKYSKQCKCFLGNVQNSVNAFWELFKIVYMLSGKCSKQCKGFLGNVQNSVNAFCEVLKNNVKFILVCLFLTGLYCYFSVWMVCSFSKWSTDTMSICIFSGKCYNIGAYKWGQKNRERGNLMAVAVCVVSLLIEIDFSE